MQAEFESLVLDLVDSVNLGHFKGLLLTCVFTDIDLYHKFTVEPGGLIGVDLFRGLMLNLISLKNFGPFKGLRNFPSSKFCC